MPVLQRLIAVISHAQQMPWETHREDQRILPTLVHDFPPRSVSLHACMAPSRGGMRGRALFNSSGTCGSVRDAPVSDGCCLRHFTPSSSPQSGGEPLHRPVPLQSTGWAQSSGVLGLPEGGGGSTFPVEKKQCFCPFCCPPCCRWVL